MLKLVTKPNLTVRWSDSVEDHILNFLYYDKMYKSSVHMKEISAGLTNCSGRSAHGYGQQWWSKFTFITEFDFNVTALHRQTNGLCSCKASKNNVCF